MKNQYKPGPGWIGLGSAVYERTRSGLRVHLYGLCVLPNGSTVNGSAWPECQVLRRYVKAAGGNRKRGCMAWANAIAGGMR